MSWLTLVVLPVVLLLYIQVFFLPYHDAIITWTQRVALLVDIGMLVLIGVFLTRAEPSFFQAFWRTTVAHPFSVFMTSVLFGIVGLMSLFLATIPGERLDVMAREALGALERQAEARESRLQRFAALPFLAFRADGSLFGVFRRHLEVTDADLVVDKEVTAGEPSLNLRGRDLRFARLDRSDLHQVDLTGANLDGASLVGADLRGAWLPAPISISCCSPRTARRPAAPRRKAPTWRAPASARRTWPASTCAAPSSRRHGARRPSLPTRSCGRQPVRRPARQGRSHRRRAGAGRQFPARPLRGADATGAQLHGADLSSAALQGACWRMHSFRARPCATPISRARASPSQFAGRGPDGGVGDRGRRAAPPSG